MIEYIYFLIFFKFYKNFTYQSLLFPESSGIIWLNNSSFQKKLFIISFIVSGLLVPFLRNC
ncbi:TPA: hypothetical protein DEG21_05145 [Patescibacteria group bacterium]|nr:hypothetical protein [Candidatus Gracilibacteria bacterium]HBY75216.1 hypothetical protein [Candidatus Gracilibacteria bacterium]